MKKIFLIVIITIFLEGCIKEVDNGILPTNLINDNYGTGAIEANIISFDEFDTEYTNYQTMNHFFVVADEKFFYTTGSYLYYYNDATKEKILIEKDLISRNIYLVGGILYYLKQYCLYEMNIESMQINSVVNALGFGEKIYGNADWRNEEFEDFYIANDIIMLVFTAVTYGQGYLPSSLTFAQIGVWEFHDEGEIDMDTGESSIEFLKLELERVNWNEDNSTYLRNWYSLESDGSRSVIGVQFSGYSFMSGREVISGNRAYSSSWPSVSNYIYGYDFEEGELIYYLEVDEMMYTQFALNQYIIFEYYKIDKESCKPTDEGIILIDTKKDEIYENEEINCLISGDIDFMDLVHADFYLKDDVLYVLCRNLDIGKISDAEYSDGLEEGAISLGYSAYKTMPSDVNIYMAEIVDGKLNFTLLYKELD